MAVRNRSHVTFVIGDAWNAETAAVMVLSSMSGYDWSSCGSALYMAAVSSAGLVVSAGSTG